MGSSILHVENLKTHFFIDDKTRKAVDGVSFEVKQGQVVCIVGESGCGKSATVLSLMKLIDDPGRIVGGSITFEDRDVLKMGVKEIQNLRGNEVSMIFQEPMHSLDPVLTVGKQIMETIEEHTTCSKKQAYQKSIEWLERTGLPNAERIMAAYPYELSGGMLQRVMIAIALCCEPKLLIADEPTTALDVTIQAQILELLLQLKEETGLSILFITHDLGVVAEIADYVIVMYAGKIIEEAPALELFAHPLHPYTKGLLKSKPVIGRQQHRLYSIKGQVPDLARLPKGCYFQDRCESCMPACREQYPAYLPVADQHHAACWLYGEEGKADEPTDR